MPTTLTQLASQVGIKPDVYIWNNNHDAAKDVDVFAAEFSGLMNIHVHHSDKNVGGFGRFMYAKQIASMYDAIVFIDDDQELHPTSIEELMREYEPKSVKGWHAFNFLSPRSYWARLPALPGGRATYIGTCGMVIDSRIFKNDRLFECPDEYWFIEDLWLCYVAEHHMGWRLQKTKKASLHFIVDTKNQFHGLMPKKTEFLRYLVRTGWRVEGRALRSLVRPEL